MMLKRSVVSLVAGIAAMGAAAAQQPPANPNAPANPAVSASPPPVSSLAPGANSFTEMQAKTRLEGQGFTGIKGLMKDNDGIWRGMAMKSGRSVNVGVDYKGNIVEK